MPLYDQFGRQIQAREQRRPAKDDIYIAQVRDRWSSYPSDGLTPTRLADIFKQADAGDVLRQAELFEEMEEKDPHLYSQLQTRKLAVQGLPVEVLPVSEDAQSKKIADFVREAIAGLQDLNEHVLDLLDAVAKGYSLAEIVWDVSASGVGVRELRWIPAKKAIFWESMTPRILTEQEPVRGIDPPPWKVIYHRYKARSGYDTRAGILRVCAWMYLFKSYSVKDWVAFAEVYGMPLRIGKYESGASAEDKAALLAAVRSIGSDAAGIVSKSTEIEFVQSQMRGGSGSQVIYEGLVGFCDAQVSKAILGQTLTSEAGGSRGQGSYALGTVHAEVRQDLVEADATALGETLTRQLIRPLVGFNYGWDAPVPRLRFLYEKPEDLETVAKVYKLLREMGFDMSQEHVSERFKTPMRKPGETPLMAAPTPSGQAEAPIAAKMVVASNTPAGEQPATTDPIVQKVSEASPAAIDALMEPIRRLVMTAGSLEEIRDGLLDIYGEMDPEGMGELMARAMMWAELLGRYEVINGD
jgi:phage gp29-like protein